MTYGERQQVYTNALIAYGEEKQCIVALEELSECAKEVCKALLTEMIDKVNQTK